MKQSQIRIRYNTQFRPLFLFAVLKISRRILLLIYGLCFVIPGLGQQMPYYTLFKENNVFLNPGVVGTKRQVDGRINYRKQWVGFDDAPTTGGISLHGRLFQGLMGLGTSYFSDQTGPTRRSNLSLAYSYHLNFEDVEISFGIAYDRLTYMVDGNKLNMHIPYDNVINLDLVQKKKVHNASAGILFYNDRFHLGVSILNLLEPSINFYKDSDSIHKTNIHMVPHIYGNVGYNWSGNPDWIWENLLQVLVAQANPMTFDYNLRLHYKQKVMGGLSVRLRDAFALQIGATLMNDLKVRYSYDIITSSLRSFQSGSHEIMLIWSSDIKKQERHHSKTDRFKKQKYGFL